MRVFVVGLLLFFSAIIAYAQGVIPKAIPDFPFEQYTDEKGVTHYYKKLSPPPIPKSPEPPEKAKERIMREEYAKRLEIALLDNGIDSHVSTSGTDLIIEYRFVSRVFAHKIISSSGSIEILKMLGFNRVRFETGIIRETGATTGGWMYKISENKMYDGNNYYQVWP